MTNEFAEKIQYPVSRRHLLGGTAAIGISALLPTRSGARTPGAAIRDRVQVWLATLSDDQRARAVYPFDSPTRRAWNYMLGSRFTNGLPLEHMSAAQKDAAMDVLATALSGTGLQTAHNIMLQQDILRDEWGKGSPERNRERFSLMVFGDPSPTAPWSWRWEGHHLTITFTHDGDQVVAQTPKAFSSEPNTVPSGPHRGLVVLPENETLGRALFSDLGGSARRAALLDERSYGNILTRPGREDRLGDPRGVALGDLPEGQADLVRRLIEVYMLDHLTGPVREAQARRLAGEDDAAIRFAWAGPNVEDQSMYYRIHGDTFLIEFATLRGQPLHHHTVVHDRQRNFGDHRVS